MNDLTQSLFEKATEWIKSADGLLITAGAGIGVDSGLPDFRGNEGFWNAYPALKAKNLDFYEIASPSYFLSDPALAWGFYGHRLNLYRKTIPHKGFHLLKELGGLCKHGSFVFTSNVDGQFQKAGFDKVVECHGSIHYLQCMNHCQGISSASGFNPEVNEEECKLVSGFPRCSICGGIMRPNILMFDDTNWLYYRTQQQQENLNKWLKLVQNLVVIEIGAGIAIQTVRMYSESLNTKLIRINPNDKEKYSNNRIVIANKALDGIQNLYNLANSLNPASISSLEH